MSISGAEIDPRSAQSQIHPLSDGLVRKEGPFVSPPGLDDSLMPQDLISQCPDDILQTIFETVVTTSDLKLSKQSVQLSSVCRHWRAVALRTPRLWTRVLLDLSAPMDRRDFIRTQIIPRSKHVPTEVTIDLLGGRSIRNMEASGIQDIPEISELTLILTDSLQTHVLFESQFTPPVGNLHSLRILSRMPIAMSNARTVVYDIFLLLERFPPFSKLEIRSMPDLKFAIGPRDSSITSLDLSSMGRIEIDGLLAAFPNLAFLRIYASGQAVRGGQNGVVRFPSLKTLVISPVTGEKWLTLLTFPRLEHLDCDGPTAAIIQFISLHPTITRLRFIFIEAMAVAHLAKAAPQLTDLTIISQMAAGIYRPLAGDSEIPFPRLKSLFILGANRLKSPIMEFDALVRARFLPMQHPKSLVKHPSHVIPTLRIQQITASSADWKESELYTESSRTLEMKSESGFQTVRLSWSERV